MKAFRAADGYRTVDLLHAAIDHSRSAGVLFEKNPLCYDSAGYLSHIGIELIFKALLLHSVGRFPAEHSLKKLQRLMRASGIKLALSRKHRSVLAMLDGFSRLRYPHPNYNPEIGSDDWTSILELYAHLAEQLPVDLQEQIRRISGTEKFGRILMRKRKDA